MDLVGALLGGIGLFLLGIKGLGANLQSLAGQRMRAAAARATRGPFTSAATGLLLGGLTQSSNAVTFILTALVQSRVLSLRQALPLAAFANPGTAGLVLLATVDIRLAVLWVIGLVGLMGALNLDRDRRLKPVLGALFGLALMFLGLDLVKEGAAELQDLRHITSPAGTAGLILPFLAGAAVTLLAQSSSTVSILALTLHAAGVLNFEQAAMAVCGASLGSGGAVLLLAAGLRGAARRLSMFQALLKAAGALLFLALLLLEHFSGLDLLLAGLAVAVPEASLRIGVLFLLLQTASALLGLTAPGRMLALLTRLCRTARRSRRQGRATCTTARWTTPHRARPGGAGAASPGAAPARAGGPAARRAGARRRGGCAGAGGRRIAGARHRRLPGRGDRARRRPQPARPRGNAGGGE